MGSQSDCSTEVSLAACKGGSELIYVRFIAMMNSYAAMGLVSSVQIRPSGGLELNDPYNQPSTSKLDDEDESEEEQDSLKVPANGKGKSKEQPKPRQGMARIIRDASGAVVEIVEADTDEANPSDTPWGKPLNDADEAEESRLEAQRLAADDGGVSRIERDRALLLPVRRTDSNAPPSAALGGETKAFHAELDQLAEEMSAPVPRFTSVLEEDWLRALIRKWGDDFEGASKDRKVNVWQKTQGEIKRA